MTELENNFNRAMFGVYENALHECDYRATIFRRMVIEHGGLETARRLLAAKETSTGFTELWMCGCLNLTVEAVVLKPEFAPLFSDAEREIARSRLAEHRYNPAA